jgi:lipopolysaccharide assembly protein A
MQIIRTIVWVAITALLIAFIAMNWVKAPVNFWPMDDGNYLHFEWPVGIIALAFFMIGLLPTWLLSKAGKWRLTRRINALENTVKANAPPLPPIATSSQLEAASVATAIASPTP